MSQLIECGNELIRINPAKNSIEYSRDGRNWIRRCSSTAYGTFLDLCLFGPNLYAVTTKGVYYSRDKGLNFISKCNSTAYGTFQTIMARGTELYAQTSKGLYCSRDEGRNWIKK